MPSPGLVSPMSSGAHSDMDYYTFLDSTASLSQYMPLFVQEGMSRKSCKEIFGEIREIGKKAEADMFLKTGGINTHKGMLFLMGISCAATGKAIFENRPFGDLQKIIKEMTAGIVEQELKPLENRSDLSHGERLYLKYKSKGVRGEAEMGLPTVFDYGLDIYRGNSHLDKNSRLVHTLIGIMSVCEDTTITHRHNPSVLEEVKKRADDIMKSGGMNTEQGKKEIRDLDFEFIKRRISPGGSADLLAITIFFWLVESYLSDDISSSF